MSANSIKFSKNTGNLGQNALKSSHFVGNNLKIQGKMSANSIKFSENLGNSGQNAYNTSQMATLIVAFPEYLGYSSQITLIV